MNRLLIVTFGSIFAMIVAVQLLISPEPGTVVSSEPATIQRASQPDAEEGSAGEQTEIKRDNTGQFHLSTQVNGQDAQFLIDTGADTVALGTDEAERLGVSFDRSTFEPITRTASGVGYGVRVEIDRMELAGRRFENVEAIVLDGLQTNLLGQSLLRRMGKVEMQGDSLVIDAGS